MVPLYGRIKCPGGAPLLEVQYFLLNTEGLIHHWQPGWQFLTESTATHSTCSCIGAAAGYVK